MAKRDWLGQIIMNRANTSCHRCNVWNHADVQRSDNPGNRGVTRVAFTGKRSVQAFPVDTGSTCNLGHPSLLGEETKGDKKNARVVILEGFSKIRFDLFLALQVIERVARCRFGFHGSSPNDFGEFFRLGDVTRLTGLVTASKQNNHCAVFDGVVQPVSWANKQPQLIDIIAKRFGVSEVSKHDTSQALRDSQDCGSVAQSLQPPVELLGLLDLISHAHSVARGLQESKSEHEQEPRKNPVKNPLRSAFLSGNTVTAKAKSLDGLGHPIYRRTHRHSFFCQAVFLFGVRCAALLFRLGGGVREGETPAGSCSRLSNPHITALFAFGHAKGGNFHLTGACA